MASTDVKLLGIWASPFVLRAKIALNIKGVSYEYSEEVRDNKSELLLKSNPIHKKVPVLIHKGRPICESMIIVQYIDEVWEGPSILPSDPLERAEARFWAVYIDDKLLSGIMGILAMKEEEAKVRGLEQAICGLKLLEGYLGEKAFFGGESVGYVDIALGCLVGLFKVTEEVENVKVLDEEKLPKLVRWAERICLDNRVDGAMPEHNKLVEFCRVLQETVWKSKPAD